MSILSREVKLIQNPALGAVLQWRFACAYNEESPTRGFAPLPLLFLTLPAVLHEQTAEFIGNTQKASGLRTFVAKFSESSISKQDVLIGLHARVDQWRGLSMDSIRLGLGSRLFQLNRNGTVMPLSLTPPRASVPASVRPLMTQAEKLGLWCGRLSMHEISTLLRIRF